ncbi:MAG TPA: polysaccharide deacetylase family protein [Epulopiscium sp.]|nr:polysaccharide deacetylase family protein [Candidatus Epulonipiscium sp.]
MNGINKKVLLVIVATVVGLAMIGTFKYISGTKKPATAAVSLEHLNGMYDATLAIEKANNKLKEGNQASAIIEKVKTEEKIVALTFDGIVDQGTTEELLKLLDHHKVKAMFFLPGIKSAEDSETVKVISKAGQPIGNYTLQADRDITKLSSQQLLEDFCQTNVILRDITGEEPTMLKADIKNYTKKLLKSSYASGLETAVHSSYFLSYQSLPTQSMAVDYVKSLKEGSIISIKTDRVLNDSEYEKPVRNKEEKPAIDPEPTLNLNPEEPVNPNKKLIEVVEFLLTALQGEDYKIVLVDQLLSYEGVVLAKDESVDKAPAMVVGGAADENKRHQIFKPVITKPKHQTSKIVPSPSQIKNELDLKVDKDLNVDKGLKVDKKPANYQEKRIQNKGNQAKIISNFSTTDPTVAYTFRGVGNKDVVENVLDVLEELDAKATFFITGKEILAYPENIQQIIDRGQQVANGGYGMITSSPRMLDFDSLSYEIDMGERYLKAFLGEDYSKERHNIYMPLYADTGGHVLEVASALGYKEVITYNKNPIQAKYKDLYAEDIINGYFSNIIALSRGDIVHFRLDYLTEKGVIEEVVRQIAVKYIKNSTYNIGDLASLEMSNLRYSPKSKADIVGTDSIQKAYGYPEEQLENLIVRNYIGNPDIVSSSQLVEFSEREIAQINKEGKIKVNNDKVIFLTFDDWGSDASITPLLNTLKKYNAKATFFIRVGSDNLSYESDFINPNLLRAVALDGHDIGNHTFKHLKINISGEAEKQMLQYDVLIAQQEMLRYIGDTGAVKPFFRPPTLAVSKTGLETVFDMGYKYIVNGDFSTHDYDATSAAQLINRLKNGLNTNDSSQEVNESTPFEDRRMIENGSVVVMHMSDESAYTAEALDAVIPYYMERGYRFAKLSDYLKNDYHNEPITVGGGQ